MVCWCNCGHWSRRACANNYNKAPEESPVRKLRPSPYYVQQTETDYILFIVYGEKFKDENFKLKVRIYVTVLYCSFLFWLERLKVLRSIHGKDCSVRLVSLDRKIRLFPLTCPLQVWPMPERTRTGLSSSSRPFLHRKAPFVIVPKSF